jgi:hypothetical protein
MFNKLNQAIDSTTVQTESAINAQIQELEQQLK